MCSVFLLLNQIKNIPLAIVSNRDEFHLRESSEIAGWDHDFVNPGNVIFAPRDEKRKGTWFAFKRLKDDFRWAILTNIRNPANYQKGLKSRGEIIPVYLNWADSSALFLEELKKISPFYNGFNLLFGDRNNIFYFHSKDSSSEKILPPHSDLSAGSSNIFTLSNSILNSPWPKLAHTQKTFADYFIKHSETSREDCWNYFKKEMHNKKKYPLSQLPRTGVSEEQEIYLSSLFIDGEIYGTRATLFFGIENDGNPFFYECTYSKHAQASFDKRIFLKSCL